MHAFRSIGVKPHLSMPVDYDGNRIPNTSILFRGNVALSRILSALVARPIETDSLSIVSVGASFGAEADSVLCMLETHVPHLGKISLTGIDTNAEIIKRAQDAKYQITGSFTSEEDAEVLQKILPAELGELSYESVESLYGSRAMRWVLDSRALRSRHNVSFVHGDIGNDDGEIPEADLILCNNVLFHLNATCRDDLVWAMTTRLKPGGLLSMELASERVRQQGGQIIASDYMPWRIQLIDQLAAKGLRPKLDDFYTGIPFAFEKMDVSRYNSANDSSRPGNKDIHQAHRNGARSD